MKRPILTLLFGLLIGGVCCYFMVVKNSWIQSETHSDVVTNSNVNRESITFILGEDKDTDNRYYEEAAKFYSSHPIEKTEYMVTSCRSLLEVRDYLEENSQGNGFPWGVINLVSHGNQWTGLRVKITPDSKRATAMRILECVNTGELKPLPASVIDEHTEIFLHGCGVGNNHQLVDAIQLAFSGKGGNTRVRASRLFEYYASVMDGDAVQSTEHYLAKSWFITYTMGEKPTVNRIVNELREKYPESSVDWRDAVSREQPRWPGDTYYYTFEVPVKWIIPSTGDSLTGLEGQKDPLDWIRKNRKITQELSRLEIPFEKFMWSFNKVYIANDNGSQSPAFFVKGYCTILCVLQAMTDGEDESLTLQKPFVPSKDDTKYYYSSFAQLISDRRGNKTL